MLCGRGFMLLPKSKSVIILVPKAKQHQPSQMKRFQKLLSFFEIIQFGSSKGANKYYLINAIVSSNPNLDQITNCTISTSDTINSFGVRNNENGVSFTTLICTTTILFAVMPR